MNMASYCVLGRGSSNMTVVKAVLFGLNWVYRLWF